MKISGLKWRYLIFVFVAILTMTGLGLSGSASASGLETDVDLTIQNTTQAIKEQLTEELDILRADLNVKSPTDVELIIHAVKQGLSEDLTTLKNSEDADLTQYTKFIDRMAETIMNGHDDLLEAGIKNADVELHIYDDTYEQNSRTISYYERELLGIYNGDIWYNWLDDYSSQAEESTGTEREYSLVGSIDSDKYHDPSCRWAKKILPENEIWFYSSDDARTRGYEPCGVCH